MNAMRNEKIILIGSIALDTINTPFDSREDILGGSTTYALIAASFKCPVSVVGIVGNDFPDTGWDIYRRHAADLSGLKVENGRTFRWGGKYHANMEDRDTLFTDLGVFETFNPVLSESNRQAGYVFLANIHPDLQLNVLTQMTTKPLSVIDTMNLWIDIARPALDDVLSKTDVLLINESEAVMYTGKEDPRDAASDLSGKGPETVIIKQGSKGASIYTGNKFEHVGVYPVDTVIDPTGAGDTFGGGFISALARGASLRDAASWGSALASVCVEGFGSEKLITTSKDEINRRYAQIRGMD